MSNSRILSDLATSITSNTVTFNSVATNVLSANSANVNGNFIVNSTGSLVIPVGNTAQRPASATPGSLRYNNTTGYFETYTSAGWGPIATPPLVTTISPSSYNGESGTQFTINGSFFDNVSTVKFITSQGTEYSAGSISFINASQLTATTPQDFTVSQEPLSVKVINGAGLAYTLTQCIDCGGTPTWNTTSGTLANYYYPANTSYSTSVSATDPDANATILYSVTSGSLPGGASLNANTGAISGTIANPGASSVTSNFDVTVTDNAGNASTRSFNIIRKWQDGTTQDQVANSGVAIYDLGIRTNGLYWIKKSDGTPIQAYIDLNTTGQDSKAGWILVASWATASEWTKDSVSSSSTFGSTALNCFSSNFGNSNMQHMRVKVSTTIDTTPGSSESDWYYYWNSAIQWKTVWSAGSGTNNHYNSSGATNGGSPIYRNSLKQFNFAYNLKFSYSASTQTWANLSDGGTTGSTGTEAWYDWYSGLTTSGYTLGVYNAGGAGRGDGTLAIIPQGDTSTTAGQDCSINNAKYGYDDTVASAWGGSSATDNMAAQTGSKGSNTNLWMWIK